MYRYSIVAFIVIFFFSCKSEPVKIAFLGDSITIGAGLKNAEQECYPAVIASKLETEFGDKYYVGNFAVSGRTMLQHGDRPLWNEPQFPASLEFAPDIVYILLGTNDSKPQNWDEFGTEFESNYRAMLDTFLVINPKVKFVMAIPPPAFKVQWGIRDSVIVNGVTPIVKQLGQEYNATIIDFYHPLYNSYDLFPDAIHPNADGAKIMADIVYESFINSSILK